MSARITAHIKNNDVMYYQLNGTITDGDHEFYQDLGHKLAEPFGWFKSNMDGWEDCAPTDEGAVPLYEGPFARDHWHPLSTPPDDCATVMLAMRHNRQIYFGYCEGGDWYDTDDHPINPLHIIGWLPAPTHPHDQD